MQRRLLFNGMIIRVTLSKWYMLQRMAGFSNHLGICVLQDD